MSRQSNNLPETSHAAYRALTPDKLAKDYADILFALKSLKEAIYEEVAKFLSWSDLNKVSRRLKEMEAAQLIYKPGNKKLTSRNRSAFTYKVVENGEQSVQPEKAMQGKSVGEFAQAIIHFDENTFN